MGNLKIKPGVITGDALKELFAYCKTVDCALPAVNVIGSNAANAALAAAREAKAPVIVQLSHTGAQFYAGKSLDNSAQRRTLVVNRHNDREFHAESDDSVRHLAEIGANEQYGLWGDGRRARPVGRDRPTPHKN